MKVLRQLLGEKPLEEFLAKHFTRLPYSSAGGAQELVRLLTWETVQRVIGTGQSVLRIVQDGKVIRDYVDLNFTEARGHFDRGHTLLLRFAERSDAALSELALDFARSFRTEVDIQLYCTPEGHNAFGWHYDVEEVFIIQAKGSKTYTIRPNTIHPNPTLSSIPKDLGYEQERTELQLTVTLEEGDWLYIPSGWWHVARTQRESMHISIGLMPASALDVIAFAPQYLAQKEWWRTRMPVHLDFPSEAAALEFYREAMQRLGAELIKELSSSKFLQAFLKVKTGQIKK
jgi:ribosomal protein L16 Arg81 hydroxylase